MPGKKRTRPKPTLSEFGGSRVSDELVRRVPALARKPVGWDSLSKRFKKMHETRREEPLPEPHEPSKYQDQDD